MLNVTNWQRRPGFKVNDEKILFEKACKHFDDGEYFEAHEDWEELWQAASGARKFYLQGLIQAAVALHHAGNANWVGTRKLLAGALGYLEKGRSEAIEVDIDIMKDQLVDFEIAVQKGLSSGGYDLPYFKLTRK